MCSYHPCMNLDSMSWQYYDEHGLPVNERRTLEEAQEAEETIQREFRLRTEMRKHEMPAREFKSQDSEVNNNSLFSKLKSFVESFVGNK